MQEDFFSFLDRVKPPKKTSFLSFIDSLPQPSGTRQDEPYALVPEKDPTFWERVKKRTTIKEGLEQLLGIGSDIGAGMAGWSEGVYSDLANAVDFLHEKTGIPKSDLFRKLQGEAGATRQMYEEGSANIPVVSKVAKGLGAAAGDIPAMMLFGTGPVGMATYQGARGMARGGPETALTEAMKGATWGMGLGAASALPSKLRMPAVATGFAATQPGDLEDKAAAAITGAALMGKQPRKTFLEFVSEHPTVAKPVEKALAGMEQRFVEKAQGLMNETPEVQAIKADFDPTSLPDINTLPPDAPIKTAKGKPEAVGLTKLDLLDLQATPDLPFRTQKYSGENPIRIFDELPFFKKNLYHPIVEARHNQAVQYKELDAQLRQMKKTLPRLKESARRLTIYSLAKQPESWVTLQKMGIKVVPHLTAEEKAIYDTGRTAFDNMLGRLNQARARAGMDPIPKVEDYFTFARNVRDNPELMYQLIFQEIDGNVWRKATEPRFEFSRKRVKSEIEFNLRYFDIFENYMKKAIRYVEIAPVLARGKLLLEDVPFVQNGEAKVFSLKNQRRNLYDYMQSWLNFSTEKIATSEAAAVLSPRRGQTMARINKNLAMAVLTANVRSALIQPTSLRNAYISLGERYFGEGVFKMMFSKEWRAFAKKHSNVLLGRNFDIHVAELKNPDVPFTPEEEMNLGPVRKGIGRALHTADKVLVPLAKAEMVPLQLLDAGAAEAAWIGSYLKAKAPMRKGGLGLTSEEAYRWADDNVTRTQASAQLHDLSPIQRSQMMRLLTVFQTFVINEWNFLSKEVLGAGGKRWGPVRLEGGTLGQKQHRAANVGRLVLGTALINALMEKGFKIRSPFPVPEWVIAEGIQKGEPVADILGKVAMEFAEQVPIVGGSIRWTTPYHTALPAVAQAYEGAVQATGKTLSKGHFKNLKLEDYTALAKLLGIPGTGQAEKFLRRRAKGEDLLWSLLGIRSEWAGRDKVPTDQLLKSWEESIKR